MSHTLSPLTAYILHLLRLQKTPKSMKWIVERVQKNASLKDVSNRQIWNSVWNGCLYPTEKPKFKQVVVERPNEKLETRFAYNR